MSYYGPPSGRDRDYRNDSRDRGRDSRGGAGQDRYRDSDDRGSYKRKADFDEPRDYKSRGYDGRDRDRDRRNDYDNGGRNFDRDRRDNYEKPGYDKYGGGNGGGRDSDKYGGRGNDKYGGGGGGGGGYRDSKPQGSFDGRNSGGKDFGGRFDGGGRFGGRGGGRGGKKPHMGEIEAIVSLVKSNARNLDEICRRIVDPPVTEKIRDTFFDENPDVRSQQYWIPGRASWRYDKDYGIDLTNTPHTVRANYFAMSPRNIPLEIFHYHVTIHRLDKEGRPFKEDLAQERDRTLNTSIIKEILNTKKSWLRDENNRPVGIVYDANTSIYATHNLQELDSSAFDEHDHMSVEIHYPPNSTVSYFVVITKVSNVSMKNFDGKDQLSLQALDVAVLNFARWDMSEMNPSWVISGSKAFRMSGKTFDFGLSYIGKLGYNASLRQCLSGMALICDVSVSCFLKGGSLPELMVAVGRFKSVEDMYSYCNKKENRGLALQVLEGIEIALNNFKIKIIHTGHTKKFKKFGPSSDHPSSVFADEENREITVAEYFSKKYKPLKYPSFPTVQVGNKKKSILIPIEMVYVVQGQNAEGKKLPAEIASNIIKYSAFHPNDRFNNICDDSLETGLISVIKNDSNCQAFGLSDISPKPMKVNAMILPPPKLQYGENRVIEPELKGAWNLAGNVKFAHPATQYMKESSICYAIVICYDHNPPRDARDSIDRFQNELERQARITNVPLRLKSQPLYVDGTKSNLCSAFKDLKSQGVKIVVVLLYEDRYPLVKYAGDSICLPTQCVKWSRLMKPPSNYHTSLMIKINSKLGGVNHTLISRMSSLSVEDTNESFQFPPKSISWFFDEPCMVVGIDINHPEVGESSGNQSVAAVVASMDGMLGQYCAHISTTKANEEVITGLQKSFQSLLKTFCARNHGQPPKRIIIYRDGVSESQIESILRSELFAYQQAFFELGFDESMIQISIILCQKRHNTRLVYEHQGEYLNPCVGLCVDGSKFEDKTSNDPNDPYGSISNPRFLEFYIASHAAVLGTSKPCRYMLIYDEIGFKLSELELLTFWTTHLYCRCTRSVSYATPAYYAHWAAKRGKTWLSAGVAESELLDISEKWLQEGENASMYFA